MKKIKTFEDFNKVNERKVNELSTALTNKAAYISSDRIINKDDRIGAAKQHRQSSKLMSYVNPELKKRLKSMGFDVFKTDYDEITLSTNIPNQGNVYIYVTSIKYDMDINIDDVDNATLAKLNRAIKLTQQELKSAIPAEKQYF